MNDEYHFTGIGYGDESADFDGSASIEQHPAGSDPMSLDGMNQASAADRMVRAEARGCASHQGGTNFDNRLSELENEAPRMTEADDLTKYQYIDDDLYYTCGENQQREWKESDNTGGEGVPPPDMPDYIRIRRI